MNRAARGAGLNWLRVRAGYAGDECLLWPFGRNNGYGSVRVGGRTAHAHRVMCLMVHGDPPEGRTDAAHTCGNKLCCTPKHLRHATPAENQRDKIAHGTIPRGERNTSARLTAKEVRLIRRSVGRVTESELARRYNITPQAVNLIVKRVNWAWLS